MQSLKVLLVLLLVEVTCTLPVSNEDIRDETKGLLDGLSSSTAAPSSGGELGGLAGVGQNVGNAGPMLIIGGFQAVVTKFDPALIQGLPGLSGLNPVGK